LRLAGPGESPSATTVMTLINSSMTVVLYGRAIRLSPPQQEPGPPRSARESVRLRPTRIGPHRELQNQFAFENVQVPIRSESSKQSDPRRFRRSRECSTSVLCHFHPGPGSRICGGQTLPGLDETLPAMDRTPS
jgi:hypothetical protein